MKSFYLIFSLILLCVVGCKKSETLVYGTWKSGFSGGAALGNYVDIYEFLSDHTGTINITHNKYEMGKERIKWEMLDNGKIKVTRLLNDSFELFHFNFSGNMLLSENEVTTLSK